MITSINSSSAAYSIDTCHSSHFLPTLVAELQFWTRDCQVGSGNNNLCFESGGTSMFLHVQLVPWYAYVFINNCYIVVRPTGDCKSMWCTWWRHAMEALSTLLALCDGNHRRPVNSPHNGPVLWTYDFVFVVSLNTLLTNCQVAGDLTYNMCHMIRLLIL